jgi:nucleoside-diphosphate-sugar epimerase
VRKPVVLITGANGEIGHALVANLAQERNQSVVSLDLNALDPQIGRLVHREITGSILDNNLLERILAEFEVDLVFHLAALLSTRAEFTPMAAHHVNVEGTLNLLEFAARAGVARTACRIRLPSSIAACGLPISMPDARRAPCREDDWNKPITMSRCNKLCCDTLAGTAEALQAVVETRPPMVDFRCVRFPGLISAMTVPSGGTSDYASEIIHAAARREPYACFVRPDTRIPFMAMPDAIEALLKLASAPADHLSCNAYAWRSIRRPTKFAHRRCARFPTQGLRITSTLSARRSSIRGPRTSTTRAHDWGFSRTMISIMRSTVLIPTVRAVNKHPS